MLANVHIVPDRRVMQLELFEVAPDVKVAAKPVQITAPRMGVVQWQPQQGGLFKPMIETHPAVVDIARWKPEVYGCSRAVITALVMAGFVEGERLSPRTLTISIESYFAWRARMRSDPFFWTDEENRARYTAALPKHRAEARPKPDQTQPLLPQNGQKGGKPHRIGSGASEQTEPAKPLKKSRDTPPHPFCANGAVGREDSKAV